jgi:NADH:ubiquinone oxidoreductase subunit E
MTRCLGTCSMAPVIMIDDQVHGNLTAEKVTEIINKY